jgi:twitching motility protein PilT
VQLDLSAASDRVNPDKDSLLVKLLGEVLAAGASDLLLVASAAPTIYSKGTWRSLREAPMSADHVSACIEQMLSARQQERLREIGDVDLAISIEGLGRFRVNVHTQRGTQAAAIRSVPKTPQKLSELGLPDTLTELCSLPSGLVLITGCTGQGKSTTLAAMIEMINQTRRAHVVTIEDPVEFAFDNKLSIIEQREVGLDSPSFASALRHVLRQRPDVILIGEMRDLETMSAALTAAETGHLVLATLHTAGAPQTLTRIIDVFPAGQQQQVRTQLSGSLRAVMCQQLVRDALNETLVPATELLIATSAIRRSIRESELHLIYGMIETGRRIGMHTMEQSLANLVKSGRVALEDAMAVASEPHLIEKLVGSRAGSAAHEHDSVGAR